MSKELDLTFVKMANEHADVVKRNAKAEAYSAKCKREEFIESIIRFVITIVVIAFLTISLGLVGESQRQSEISNVSTVSTTESLEV